MKTIIISPYSKRLRNGQKDNPKNYPYWEEVVKLLKSNGWLVVQVGIAGEEKIKGVDDVQFNLPLKKLAETIKTFDTWISVDNFFQHMATYLGKKGVVLFGQSDPNIFGYKTNVNLLKHRKYLREKQFDIWEACKYREDAFVLPSVVLNSVKQL